MKVVGVIIVTWIAAFLVFSGMVLRCETHFNEVVKRQDSIIGEQGRTIETLRQTIFLQTDVIVRQRENPYKTVPPYAERISP